MPTIVRRAVLPTLLVCAGLLAGCGARQAAPSFDYTLLDGNKLSSQTLRGKVLLVNFWATTCTTCVKEMPQIVAMHRQFAARAYDTLAVSMQYDPPAAVWNFAQARQLPFGVAIDNTGAIAQAFGGVPGTPTTFVIDKRGAIAQRYVGEPDFAQLHRLVEQLLAEPA